jgi:hypothetical protein
VTGIFFCCRGLVCRPIPRCPKFIFEIVNSSSYRRLGQLQRGRGHDRSAINTGTNSNVHQIHTLLVTPSVLQMFLCMEGIPYTDGSLTYAFPN